MPLNPVKTTTATEPAGASAYRLYEKRISSLRESSPKFLPLTALGIVAMSLNGVPAYGAQEGGGTNAAEPAVGAQITDAQYWYGHAAMSGDHVSWDCAVLADVRSKLR